MAEPFRPLRPFLAQDRRLFFGRELATRDLRALLADDGLCVLHGSSGCGKTSLLQAGLRPILAEGWRWLQVTPEGGLGGQVLAAARGPLEALGQDVPAGPGAALRRLAELGGPPLLLVIDQAEELFQVGAPQQEAAGLAALLQEALGPGLRVLLIIRADYLGHLELVKAAGLRPVFERTQLLLPLDTTGSRLAIEEPLRLAGITLAPGLAQRMQRDLAEEGAQVSPVELELVCQGLLERAGAARPLTLTAEHYDDMGGAGKVLATYLAQAQGKLTREDRPRALRLLRQLLGAEGTRLPALAPGELAARAGLPESEAAGVLERLVRLRLLRGGAQEGGAAYRLAHDRLAAALYEQLGAEERRDLALREFVRRKAAAWQESGRPRWLRVDAEDRRELLQWQRRNAALPLEVDYLAQVGRVDRWARRLGRFGPAVLVVLVVGLAGLVVRGRQQARLREAELAETKAEAALKEDPSAALAWLGEAARLRGGIAGEPERSFHEHWLLAREAWDAGLGWQVAQAGQEVQKVAFNPGGDEECDGCWPRRRLLAYASRDGTVGVVDLKRGGPGLLLPERHSSGAMDVAFSPDGRWLASSGLEGTVRIWALRWEGQKLQSSVAHVHEEKGIEFNKVLFSPNRRWLAFGALTGRWGLLGA